MPGPPAGFIVDSSDATAIARVRVEILRRLPKGMSAEGFFTGVVRRAIDEVLTLNKSRFRIDQLAAPEQTYIGTRSEILIRDGLDVGVGARADALIADTEVDLKWSRKLNWMIGPENLGTVCLGVGTNNSMALLSVGLFVPRADRLGKQNRDAKYTAGATFRRDSVVWIVYEAPLPRNFMETVSDDMREDIMSKGSAQNRLRRLAELLPNKPIPRAALRFVSLNKDDFMRRIREDNSRSSPPLGDMVCLSWKYKKAVLARLGIQLKKDEFVFVRHSDLAP